MTANSCLLELTVHFNRQKIMPFTENLDIFLGIGNEVKDIRK